MLEAIGWWFDPDEPEDEDPRPQKCIERWNEELKEKVLNYLQSGVVTLAFLGYDSCRFNCGIADSDLGSREFTDGKYVWPESLPHYIRAHNVSIPNEFIDFMKSREFEIPKFSEREISRFVESARNEGYATNVWHSWNKS